MATYSNQHWLLCHIRNSFVSTDDTGICETVMQSDDLPKHFLKKFSPQEVEYAFYPGLDQSDDEDIDPSSQSYDIQMYPEVGAHRFRSNTAQKLEKMDIARRKAARTKCVNFDDEIVPPERSDFFVRKPVGQYKIAQQQQQALENRLNSVEKPEETGFKSKLSFQLANSPKQTRNKFMEYARFDGTSQIGVQTKRINVFLSMLPKRERNYPMKICVLANAKILEVIGFVCYKASIQFPEIPLKSIQNYALYMTEDNDDMEDFPPLDNREPCSKFGFSHLTLAERRPLVPVTRIDYNNTLTKSMTSEEDKARLAAAAVRSLQGIQLNGGKSDEEINELPSATTEEHLNDHFEALRSHNDMLEAPMYRTFRLNIIDKPFFKTPVTLGISGERIEIDQQKNSKFWSKQKAVSYPIKDVAHCEIVERRNTKGTIRIYLKSASSSASEAKGSTAGSSSTNLVTHSPTSPGHAAASHMASSPFSFFINSMSHSNSHQHQQMRFKHYDFETSIDEAEHILNKLNCIFEVRSSEARREFLSARERKLEKQAKKNLKM